MNTPTCYTLVSQVNTIHQNSCGKPDCGTPGKDGYNVYCHQPERPRYPRFPGEGERCVCVPSRQSATKEQLRQYRLAVKNFNTEEKAREPLRNAWYEAHHHPVSTGGTRLGPMHYFQDCRMLTRRATAGRIVALDADTAKLLGLPMCATCAAKMAPFEKQLAGEVKVNS